MRHSNKRANETPRSEELEIKNEENSVSRARRNWKSPGKSPEIIREARKLR